MSSDGKVRELDIEEIREMHKLGRLYFSSAKQTSEFDVERFHTLSDKYSPIDIMGFVLDHAKDLQEKCAALEFEVTTLKQTLQEQGEELENAKAQIKELKG